MRAWRERFRSIVADIPSASGADLVWRDWIRRRSSYGFVSWASATCGKGRRKYLLTVRFTFLHGWLYQHLSWDDGFVRSVVLGVRLYRHNWIPVHRNQIGKVQICLSVFKKQPYDNSWRFQCQILVILQLDKRWKLSVQWIFKSAVSRWGADISCRAVKAIIQKPSQTLFSPHPDRNVSLCAGTMYEVLCSLQLFIDVRRLQWQAASLSRWCYASDANSLICFFILFCFLFCFTFLYFVYFIFYFTFFWFFFFNFVSFYFITKYRHTHKLNMKIEIWHTIRDLVIST